MCEILARHYGIAPVSEFDDAIAEIESGLQKLRELGDARYKAGVADERARAIAAIQAGPGTQVRRLLIPAKKTTVVHSNARARAPKGLSRQMVERALKESGGRAITSTGVHLGAKNDAEKAVSISALRNDLRAAKKRGLCDFKDGKWYARGDKK